MAKKVEIKEKKKVGPKFRFNEKTVQVKFTIPGSKEPELRSAASKLINKWIKEGV